MSRNGAVRSNSNKRDDAVTDQNATSSEEEEETEEEEEDEEFYESLDRIASSSCSCSASNSDSDPDPARDDIAKLPPASRSFPSAAYDVWISEPAPVSERRHRLLLQMGLLRSDRRSASSGILDDGYRQPYFPPEVASEPTPSSVLRSKSDGADRTNCPESVDLLRASCSSYSAFSEFPVSDSVNSCSGQCGNRGEIGDGGGVAEISPKSAAGSPNKPPSGKFGGRSRGSGMSNENVNGNGDFSNHSSSGELRVVSDVEVAPEVCLIKDLDNGKEFVVNEVNKLREVGTGRQLTIEEFEMCVGHSPIVQELMRRQNVEVGNREQSKGSGGAGNGVMRSKKKGGSWFRGLRNVASSMKGHKEKSSDEKDTGSERAGRRSSSATDDSQDVSFHGPERVRVKQYGKTFKELSALYKSQEIRAHNGSIWSIKFSLDGRYLASAGEDGVIHVWQVVESERKGELLMDKQDDGNFNLLLLANGSPEPSLLSPSADSYHEKKRRGRPSISRKSLSLDHIFVPETVFALTEKPVCSFHGHRDDVLDLSWSKSQHLLSSSMDKTVRLWHLSSKTCLKTFSHSDYVTCIQFNPVDDRYFISGSLDAKVRIWSIPDHQVVDWTDVHEMVTAACYTPDGQGALVGSYKGNCRLYNTSENKLLSKCHINLQNKKKKAHLKKITGFQFAPGSSSEVLVSSADSRIRVVDGVDLVHKFKGFRNTNSQISASVAANGKYVVTASEDSSVYIWKHEAVSRPSRSKGVIVTHSYEHFHCQDVSVAVPWPGMSDTWGQDLYGDQSRLENHLDEVFMANHPPTPVDDLNGRESSEQLSRQSGSPLNGIISNATNSYFFDRISATWPEEKLSLACRTRSPRASVDIPNGLNSSISAHGMVIVTAGLRGEIRTFQNFGLPVRI